jgi:AbiV family abortive infection protein
MGECAIDKQLLSEIVRGAEKTFKNAESLFEEASLLKKSGFLSRALFLHQISLEECAKIDILGAHVTSMLMGQELDVGKLQKVLVSHAHKNRTNAYFLDGSVEEEAAKASGDFEVASAAFAQMQKEFHVTANVAKNASLYVDFKDGQFVAPIESITVEMVHQIAAMNHKFLGLSFHNLKMLRKFEVNPENTCKLLEGFEGRMQELKHEYVNDPVRAIEIILQELRERMSTPDST